MSMLNTKSRESLGALLSYLSIRLIESEDQGPSEPHMAYGIRVPGGVLVPV